MQRSIVKCRKKAVVATLLLQAITIVGSGAATTFNNLFSFQRNGAVNGMSSGGASSTANLKKKLKKRGPNSVPNNDTSSSASNDDSFQSEGRQQYDKMPSLFTLPEEVKYDKYAACLAATEGLRRARDATLPKNMRRNKQSAAEDGWRSFVSNGASKSKREELYQRACAQYVWNSRKVIRALGLTVSQFNQLGREVGKIPVLKERVMEQAYLYRIAATVHMDKIPFVEDSESAASNSRRRRRVQMFARSMIDIEELRTEQIQRLKRALNVEKFPDGIHIGDPALLPILDPRIRAVCEAFPLQAEEIVKTYGLNSDEFNRMLGETRGNPIFRWRVQNYIGKKKQTKSDDVYDGTTVDETITVSDEQPNMTDVS